MYGVYPVLRGLRNIYSLFLTLHVTVNVGTFLDLIAKLVKPFILTFS